MTLFVEADTPEYIEEEKKLFREYAESLGCSPCFQNIEKELAELPGEYASPSGRLVLALYDGRIAGTVALRKIDEQVCEMRRLYVRPAFRGKRTGRALADMIIKEARNIGYESIRLYTLPSMVEAISLYRSMGFKDIAAYGDTIVDDALYMELSLH